MTGFLDFNAAAGMKTILLEEAYSVETDSPQGLFANHQILKRLGRKYRVVSGTRTKGGHEQSATIFD
jgi:hypothetical protein